MDIEQFIYDDELCLEPYYNKFELVFCSGQWVILELTDYNPEIEDYEDYIIYREYDYAEYDKAHYHYQMLCIEGPY